MHIPGQKGLEKICQTFHSHLTGFEKKNLNSKRIQDDKQERVDDRMMIFQDLQKEPTLPVQVLVDQKSTRVTEVDQEESAGHIHPEC